MVKRLLLAFPLAVVGAAWFYWIALPWPVLLRTRDPDTSAVMRQRIAEARSQGEDFEIRREWVPLDRISNRLQRAVITAEDGRFHDHDGVDWNALREEFRYSGDDEFSWLDLDDLRALRESLSYYINNRDKVRGRSTITQQLAKNLYFSTDRSAIRKFEEYIVARRLEIFLSKDRILEIYLNIAEWGPGVFGAEAAAQHYFGRAAADLTADQAAALAATLPHPLTSNPKQRPGRMEWRKGLILGRMGGSGPVQTVPLEPANVEPEPERGPIGAPAEPEPAEPEPAPAPPDSARNPVPPAADTLLPRPVDPPDTTAADPSGAAHGEHV
ncbi:MAG: transglycosylase domain-containing protein [Gemmatimonadetes bacterium]|nr:transglycosylase domain-containing protein [Gemmatimonadota bacterium]